MATLFLLIYYLKEGKGEAISGASFVPFYRNGSYFTGQRTNVWVLAAAKYFHPNCVLRDQVHNQMVGL